MHFMHLTTPLLDDFEFQYLIECNEKKINKKKATVLLLTLGSKRVSLLNHVGTSAFHLTKCYPAYKPSIPNPGLVVP